MQKIGFIVLLVLTLAGCAPEQPKPLTVIQRQPKIALVLGGGAARGFAHVGVIKVLEAQGIYPDMVVGTSAGSVVGALYAGGYSGFDLQKMALKIDESSISDFSLPDRGFIKGELLQNFVNHALKNRSIEQLNKPFVAVATDLQSGQPVLFRRGNTGIAVRASSTVPGVFQPVSIDGHEYVDGGLTCPVPVKIAKSLGADIVIAVDISAKPKGVKVSDSIDMMLQTFSIMGQTISSYELAQADVVIRPHIGTIGSADFDQKDLAILEGEKAAQAALPAIRQILEKKGWKNPAGELR